MFEHHLKKFDIGDGSILDLIQSNFKIKDYVRPWSNKVKEDSPSRIRIVVDYKRNDIFVVTYNRENREHCYFYHKTKPTDDSLFDMISWSSKDEMTQSIRNLSGTFPEVTWIKD